MSEQGTVTRLRIPPQNLDAERSVLGGVLLEESAFAEVKKLVRPRDFYREAHGKIFEAMLALNSRGEPVDRVTVKDELTAAGVFRSVGGDDFLDLLDKVVPVTTNVAWYARIVSEKARVRRMIDVATAIATQGYEQAGDAQEFVDDASLRILALRELDQAPSTSSLLGFRSLDEVLDEELPEIEWLWEPYIEAGIIAAIVAPPNIGKTLIAFHCATEAANKGGRVDIVELEGGKRGFKKRVSRAITAAGGREKCRSIRTSFKPRFSLLDPKAVEAMCVECKGSKLIIIDSLACATPGLEENDVTAMGQVVRSLQIIQAATGATILILHHTTKSTWKQAGETPAIGDGRGSGALDAALDTILALAPIPEAEEVSGFVSFTLYNTKQRDEEKAPPRLVRIAMVGVEATVELLDPHLLKHEKAAEKAAAEDEEMKTDIWNALPESEASAKSKNQIHKEVGGNRKRFFELINKLIIDGWIRQRGERVYRSAQEVLDGVQA